MKIKTKCALLVLLLLGGCGSHVKVTNLKPHGVIEKDYLAFSANPEWYFTGEPWVLQADGKAQFARIHSDPNGATYTINIEAWPFNWLPWKELFDKNAVYETVLKDEDMVFSDSAKEQGMTYKRLWTSYVQGLKCTEGVFSRSPVGMMRGMSSKNYSLTCGYYDKSEGKRLLHLSYRYSYAGGSLRHQKDANTPQNKLITLKQAELGLKNAVKQLIETIKIKNFDRERMKREGLIHVGEFYEISPF